LARVDSFDGDPSSESLSSKYGLGVGVRCGLAAVLVRALRRRFRGSRVAVVRVRWCREHDEDQQEPADQPGEEQDTPRRGKQPGAKRCADARSPPPDAASSRRGEYPWLGWRFNHGV
jgi:hypothetical protein